MTMAALVLASGLSRRYGSDDKLMAELKGQALLAYCLDTVETAGFQHRFIVCPDPDPRAELARRFGFSVIANQSPEDGQGTSISLGARHVINAGFDTACILLGDMPFITADYLKSLRKMNGDIVFSQVQDIDQPPAVFRLAALKALTGLSGDKGAGALDLSCFNVSHMKLPAEMSVDFDTEDDFKAV